MKIALISPGILPVPAVDGGAVETLIDTLIDYIGLNCPNILVDVYTLDNNQISKYKNINYIKVSNGNNYIFRVLNKICKMCFKLYFPSKYDIECLKILNKTKYDKVIVENDINIIQYLKSDYIILHLHNDYINIENKCSKNILEKCSEIWTVSNFLKKRILDINSKYSSKVYVCDNGVKNRYFSLNKLNFNKYVYVGRIAEEKGVYELIRAFNMHLSKYPMDELFIYGGSFFNNSKKNSYYTKCKNEIKNSNIHMMGYVSNDKLLKEIKKYSFSVIPAIWEEPFGLVLIEQIFNGLIPIISNSAGLVEIIGVDYPLIANKEGNYIKNLVIQLEKIKELSRNKDFINYYIKKSKLCFEKYSYEEYCNRILSRLKI